MTGDPNSGVSLSSVGILSAFNDNGLLTFTGIVGTTSDVFVGGSGGISAAVATTGEATPAGGSLLLDVPLQVGNSTIIFLNSIAQRSNEGDLSIQAYITGGNSNTGLFIVPGTGPNSGALQSVILQGQAVPGGGTFNTINPQIATVALGPDGQVAMVADFTNASGQVNEGIFLGRGNGTVARIIAAGDTVPGGGVLSGVRMASFLTAGGAGQFAFIADINGGSARQAILSTAVASGTATSTTTLASSQNPSTFGQSVTLTATVTPVSGTTVPTGTVTFFDNGSSIGTGTLNSGGQATLSTSSLAVGAHPILAQYDGDTNFGPGSSTPLVQNIDGAGANATLTALNSSSSGNISVFGQPVTFTATVTSTAPGTPTGTVSFFDGASLLGIGMLSGGQTTLNVSSLSVGSHSISAQYDGDASFAASSSTSLTQTVNASSVPSPVITSVSPAAVVAGGPALTLMVTGANFVPASIVQFNGSARTATYLGSTQLSVSITAADIASAGWDQITVSNPSGGGISNAVALAVTSGGISPTIGTALNFVPVTPCRLVDTRGATGAFGGPSIAGGTSRNFTIPQNTTCNIPSTAAAYSLNVAVVPSGALGYVTLWPAGQTQPGVATLSSIDGRVRSNAAIVPAGAGGAVSVFASNATDVVMDINGYFTTASTALQFYPVAPCRILDTRNPTAPLGGPFITGNTSRTFPLPTGACNLPGTAQAYSLNLAVVPQEPLGYLTAWPTGQTQPPTANLSSTTGTVTASAAIVPAGTNGSIDVYASNSTNLIIDVNGYFAPAGAGGLSLYNLTPCRVLDTRQLSDTQTTTPFGGELDESVQAGACGVPVGAQAYVLNATVVPSVPLGFLTLWPQGTTQPLVATLSALDQSVTSNLAIVPTTNGSIATFASNPTQLIMDLFGYFAPSSQAPEIISGENTTFVAGASNTFTVAASGFPAASFTETGALPTGVSFDAAAGVLSGTPTTSGLFPITFSAQNGVLPNDSQNFLLTVDAPPAITSANNTTSTVGTAGAFTVTATGFPSAAFNLTAGTLPTGVTFSTVTGVLSGTPAAGTGGIYMLTLAASNGAGTAATQTFTLTVNQAPAVTSAVSATFAAGLAYSFTVTATGFPAPAFTETGALPSGVTFNSTTAVLSGTPATGTNGTYPITITASNGVGTNATQSFTLTIVSPVAPAITSSASTTFTEMTPGTFSVTSTGAPPPTYFVSGVLPAGIGLNAATGVLSGTPPVGSAGTYPLTITAQNGVLPNATQSFTLTVTATPWTLTGSMTTSRALQTATLLNSGKVLIAGGLNGSSGLSSAELYDPSTGAFTATGSMTTVRDYHSATLLNNGYVLITGGVSGSVVLSSAELYNPSTGSFTATGSMNSPREYHSATLLSNGKVLIAGGYNGTTTLSSAEVYDPVTGIFTVVGSMTGAHYYQSATLMNNGKVLIAGGVGSTFLSSAEVYDPSAGTFTATGSMSTARELHTATLLNNGKVLIAGGYIGGSSYLSSAEQYDPSTGTFTVTGSMTASRYYHKATLLNNGKVLIVGGFNSTGLSSAEQYDPSTGSFAATGNMTTVRYFHTATLLSNGKVLVAGGLAGSTYLSSAELFQPATLTPPNLVSIAVTPANPSIPQGATQIFTATGTFSDNSTQQLASATWSSSNTSVAAVTNDSTNHGEAYVLASAGSTTMTACTGSICGSTTLTGTPAPYITSSASATFEVGTAGSFTVMAVGTPAPTLSESGALPSGVTFNTSTGVLSGTPAAGTSGTYPITFTASNGVLPNASQNFTLTVSQAPLFTSAASATFTVGTAGTFTVTASGLPTPALSSSGTLPSGVTFNSSTGVLGGTPAAGTGKTYPITFTASNGALPNATQSFTLTVNQSPAITSAASAQFTVGLVSSFTVTATGFPSPTFSETGALPSGVTLNSTTGVLGGTPATGTTGTYPVTVTASNVVGTNATQSFTLTVASAVAPTITSAAGTSFNAGISGTFTVTATGSPSPAINLTSGTLPSGVIFTATTHVLSGTPATGTAGTYPLTFTASNGVLPNATQNFTLTVNATTAPTITSANATTFSVGTAGSFTVTATGKPTPTYSWSGTFPSGLSFNSTTGVLSGTPAAGTGGTYPLTFIALNGVGANATQSFTLTVNQAPAITSAASTAFGVGVSASFTVTASGFPASTSFSESGTLPSGVTFNNSTGLLSGTPATGTGGTYPITFTVSNGVLPNGIQSFTLTVGAPVAPAITSAAATAFFEITPGTFQVTGAGVPTPSYSVSGTLPTGVTINAVSGVLSGTPPKGAAGTYPFTVIAQNGVLPNVTQNFTLTVNASPWTSTGNMTVGRGYQTATLLNNGKVLIAGGCCSISSAEMYDPTTGTFTATGSMTTARESQTATLLNNGKVLITGGYNGSFLSSAELYDPSTGTFTATGSMTTGRYDHTATLLNNGKVLIAGGYDGSFLSSAELYDPSTGTFTATGSMTTGRYDYTATLLNNGKVLVAGGGTASADIYDPATGTFMATGNMTTARYQHTATLLNNGKVLVAGGDYGPELSSAEVFDPSTGTFTATGSMSVPRGLQTATLLNNGKVLVAGGYSGTAYLSSTELYDPSAGAFIVNGSMANMRYNQTATLLNSGKVLLAGGFGSNTSSAELYQPTTLAPTNLVSIAVTPVNPSVPQNAVQVFTATGTFSDNSTQQLVSATWTSSNTAVAAITNDSTNHGVAYVVATTGSTTITACTGSICGSTTLSFGAGAAPSITSVNTATFTEGVAGSFAITAAGSPSPTYSVSGALPNGVTLNAISGALSGTPAAGTAGTYPLTLTAQNGVLPNATQSFTVTVTRRPAITSVSSITFAIGIANSFTVTATGSPTPALSLSETLPSGVSFNASTGALAGTPAAGTAGTYPLTFNAQNGVLPNATQNFILTVAAPVAPSITSATATTFLVGTAGSFTVTASGAPTPNTYAVSGTLPGGVTLNNSTGVLSGVPVTGSGGTYPVTITVSNGVVPNAQQNFTLTVNEAPTITSATSQAFTVSVAGAFTVTASGFPIPTFLESGALPSGVTFNGTTGVFSGIPAAGTLGNTYPITITAQNGVGAAATQNFTLSVTQWFMTGKLNFDHFGGTGTLLQNGKVLVVGDSLAADLYDPASGTFSTTANLVVDRYFHGTALLNNGKVLLAGGFNVAALTSVELYDPSTGKFTATGSMAAARAYPTATVLNNGKVLIAGGYDLTNYLSSAELYDPSTGTFTTTGSMTVARCYHTATLLNNGKVLIAGGSNSANVLSSAELYDPSTGIFTAVGNMTAAREDYTATLLNSGKVLLAGGFGGSSSLGYLSTAELYDPSAGTFTSTGNMIAAQAFDSATLLTNGQVLIAGGYGGNTGYLSTVELYNPATGTFSATGNMVNARGGFTLTLLNNGNVLATAGYTTSVSLTTAEIYPPGSLTPSNLVSIAVTPANPSIAVGNTQQFIATGTFSDTSTQQLSSVTWSSSNTAIATIGNDSSNHGTAIAVAAGSATITACTGSICGATTLTSH